MSLKEKIKKITLICLPKFVYKEYRLFPQILKCMFYKKIIAVKKFLIFKAVFPLWYLVHAQAPINSNKVILIVPGVEKEKLDHNFDVLYATLEKYYTCSVEIFYQGQHILHGKQYFFRCLQLVKKLAHAQYVFISDANNIIHTLPIRKECVITQLWHGCGAFKKFGFSTAELLFGGDREEKEKYPYYGKEAYVTVSSKEVIWAYAEAMGIPEKKIRPVGVSRTDVFFDENFIIQAEKKLKNLIPQACGKKIILYAPTFRGSIRSAKAPDQISFEAFHTHIADKYVLLIKHHPFVLYRPFIEETFQDFVIDCTEKMEIEELLCVSDICISDYSSLIYEFSLFNKPMLFFAYDLEEYFDWRGFYYDYNEMTPGPVFRSNEEMIYYIMHIDKLFEPGIVQDFKEKFMSACDGHSTERILEMVFGNKLNSYKKQIGDDRSML